MAVPDLSRPCQCAARREAVRRGDFLPSFTLSAWIAVDAPKRRVSQRTLWYLSERGEFDTYLSHAGDAYSWVTCPWCGHDLPPVTASIVRQFLAQADGEPEPPPPAHGCSESDGG